MTNFSIVLVLSVVFTLILKGPAGWQHPRGASPLQGNIFLFLLFSMTMLAVSKWLSAGDPDPAHPHLPWMASLCTGIILFAILAVFCVPSHLLEKRHENIKSQPLHDKPQAHAAFIISFWVLLGVLIALLLI